MPVAVAGQLMAVPVDFLYGIPVGLDHSARHKKGRFVFMVSNISRHLASPSWGRTGLVKNR